MLYAILAYNAAPHMRLLGSSCPDPSVQTCKQGTGKLSCLRSSLYAASERQRQV